MFLKQRQDKALVVMRVGYVGYRYSILIGDGAIIDNVLDWESGTLNLHHPYP